MIIANLANRCDLGCCARQPALLKPFQLFWHNMPLDHTNTFFFKHFDNRLTGYSIQKGIRGRRMYFAIFDKENIGARGLGNIAAIIKHHCIAAAFGFGRMF